MGYTCTFTPTPTAGAKWQSIGTEKQDKYRQQYQDLKVEYEAKLVDFYNHHPDAKVPTRWVVMW